ncbi:flagellar hook-basal body complex protein FliE [Lawsonia intracellularis]|nr:flagellar hook-basal body complex protein FliE [Lawsonia intracellularis]RBN35671.1 flagellar hook-basal body complex protein FliE [Lawsonia intracellularis]
MGKAMSIQSTGLKAYTNVMSDFKKVQDTFKEKSAAIPQSKPVEKSFADTFKDSLSNVNEMQTTKSQMIQSFASGETQNVHELMITLQKAGLAINMTSAVRNKVLEAYKELSRLQF